MLRRIVLRLLLGPLRDLLLGTLAPASRSVCSATTGAGAAGSVSAFGSVCSGSVTCICRDGLNRIRLRRLSGMLDVLLLGALVPPRAPCWDSAGTAATGAGSGPGSTTCVYPRRAPTAVFLLRLLLSVTLHGLLLRTLALGRGCGHRRRRRLGVPRGSVAWASGEDWMVWACGCSCSNRSVWSRARSSSCAVRCRGCESGCVRCPALRSRAALPPPARRHVAPGSRGSRRPPRRGGACLRESPPAASRRRAPQPGLSRRLARRRLLDRRLGRRCDGLVQRRRGRGLRRDIRARHGRGRGCGRSGALPFRRGVGRYGLDGSHERPRLGGSRQALLHGSSRCGELVVGEADAAICCCVRSSAAVVGLVVDVMVGGLVVVVIGHRRLLL